MSNPTKLTASGEFGQKKFINDDVENSQSTEKDAAEGNELDIDFSITESGRTVAHLIAHMKQDGNVEDDMDFSISSSGRTIDNILENGEKPLEGSNDLAGKKSVAKSMPKSVPTFLGPSNDYEQDSNSICSSGSAFVSGLMSNQSGVLSHTPPTGSSYEARLRAGSVSGRLRSASDLEDKGIIDRNQKGVLKDLIISGDEALQEALDKYEKGDKSKLESMIKSGLLSQKLPAEIDFLGDLDLDFLTVDDGTIGSMENQNVKALPHPASTFPSGSTIGEGSSYYDGIGDLDFSSDLDSVTIRVSTVDPTDLDLFRLRANSLRSDSIDFRDRSNSTNFLLRDRANSTAQLPQHSTSESDATTINANDNQPQTQRWMDQPVPRKDAPSSLETNNSKAGIGASLAEYNRSTKKLTKAQIAEEKRRERQLKREIKEREKQQLKEMKEKERREKREQKEREKQSRKEKKAQKVKQKQEEAVPEEPKIIQSGSGRPRSMSDPNIRTSIDSNGLLQVDRPDGWVGAYSPESRKLRIERFMEKRNHRVWTKSVKYDVRKNFADSRLRVKGRFVKKEDELLMRELMSLT
eukprot:CAMPEP_0178936782 /NCGR_PEP_ID=MMETSP0786-20121207/25377_1 /TAXON_ID=186022 /ORGANISM="Thalassionema frauenfeldii, Strain CCMP 1798" /LENGTH=578 /DNA_ID=CAMNT_0020615249 /DNA_START=56 /DNA_END=1793 /DNA_ORIENTATION=-